ncbi:hypothetical protein KXV85_005607, partial [Aspergillus fumigatus]
SVRDWRLDFARRNGPGEAVDRIPPGPVVGRALPAARSCRHARCAPRLLIRDAGTGRGSVSPERQDEPGTVSDPAFPRTRADRREIGAAQRDGAEVCRPASRDNLWRALPRSILRRNIPVVRRVLPHRIGFGLDCLSVARQPIWDRLDDSRRLLPN